MDGLRVGAAVAAVLVASGCGGSGSDSTAPTKTTDVPAIQMVDACPKVQKALVDNLSTGGPLYSAKQYEGFATDLEAISASLDASGRVILLRLIGTLHDSADNAADPGATPKSNASTGVAWLTEMKRVSQTCKDLGAPLP